VIDAVAKAPRQLVVAVMDDNPSLHGSTINGVPIIGNVEIERAVEMLQGGAFDAAVISVSSSIPFRARIFEDWSARGIPFANVIHPSAVVGSNVAWGHGNVVLAFCHVGACATIGNDNFLSAYCSIEHHSVLHDHCSFGPGVVTSMGVRIADRVRFGTGIFIEPNLNIGTESVIGSGCTLWQHVSPRTVLKSRLNYVERPLRIVLAQGHERARVNHEQRQPVARTS
jgi:acetyltransferase-like isoleucine patch superfamily enzyme